MENANDVFQFNGKIYIHIYPLVNYFNKCCDFEGWSSEIRSQKIDFIDVTQDGKHSVAVTSVVRITLQDGSFREDVGVGLADNLRSKGDAIEKARKSSVTDGMKRALRLFGNAMGLSVGMRLIYFALLIRLANS